MSSCPFVENHWRGDRSPSFSSRIDDSGPSPYFCFSCHERGTLEYVAVHSGNQDLVPEWQPKKERKDEPWLRIPSTNVGVFGSMFEKKIVFFDEELIKPFVGRVSKYVLDRGITLDTARTWELGVDRVNRRAIFVLRDMEGKVAVVIGRDVSGRSKIRYSNYLWDKRDNEMVPFPDHSRDDDFEGPTKSFFLYGERLAWLHCKGEVERRSSDLVLVEGAVDVLKVWQLGWNVVALLGSHLSNNQIDKVVGLLPKNGRVIMMMDGDKAGRTCAKEAGSLLVERVPVMVATLSDGMDPGAAPQDEINDAIESAKVFSLTMFK